MPIDLHIPTIIVILGLTHLMQVIVFYHQYRINKTYKGIGWWLLWSAAEVFGFSFILLRNIPSILPLVIILQNSLIVAGTVFIYAGVRQFFDKPLNFKLLLPILSLFFAGLLFFLFIKENLVVRSVIINSTIAVISFITAFTLFRDRPRSVSASANFNGGIFMVHGGIFIYRAVMISEGGPDFDFLANNVFNLVPFFDALIVSLLWTFGFIIMLNSRLNADVSEAKDQLQQIFTTSPDAAVITSIEGGRIVNFNEGYTAITGYTAQDMAGKTTKTLNIWKNFEDRDNVIRIIREKGYCENYEAQFILKDGREITGLMSAKIINLDGIPHLISISRDISERKQAEEALRQKNEQLLKADAEKDKFFSILAHDLRSPFNSLLGFTQLLEEGVDTLKPAEIARIAGSMRKSTINLYRLLDNLLEWSQIQRGNVVFNPQSCNVKQVITEAIEVVNDTSRKKAVKLILDIKDDIRAVADVQMISTIIRNLVFNSVKFTQPGGKIHISARQAANRRIEVSVTDTGIGMSPNLVANLFLLDSKSNRRGTEGESSTGLGLIICREFIEKHGGSMKIESTEGKGTRMSFTVPQSE